MNGWNVLGGILGNFPLLTALMFVTVALAVCIVFIVGFSKRGINFLKFGFGQTMLDASIEKRFDDLAEKMATKDDIARLYANMATIDANMAAIDARMATKDDIARLDAKIAVIEANHFGHLKNYLGILNGVLLDKKIIDNETKARMDNELRGM